MQSSKSDNVYRCSHHQYANCIMYVANDPKSICPICNCVMNGVQLLRESMQSKAMLTAVFLRKKVAK
ncbi:hypothetical protein PTKIN_Ptkin16aG0488500 [Pterospermum kingtungense]